MIHDGMTADVAHLRALYAALRGAPPPQHSELDPGWLHPTWRATFTAWLDGSTGDLFRSPVTSARTAYAAFSLGHAHGLVMATAEAMEGDDEIDGQDHAAVVAWLRRAATAKNLLLVWERGSMRVERDEHGYRFLPVGFGADPNWRYPA